MKKSLQLKIAQVAKFVPPKNVEEEDHVKKCKKCKGELLVLSRQTRSADEGATTFYNCKKCLYTIKIQ